jgi:uncharacterized membrane protein YdjX (TVP38/TMEM64 family)
MDDERILSDAPEREEPQRSESPSGAEAVPIDWNQIKAFLKRLGPVGVLAAIAATLPAIGGFVLLYKGSVIAPWLRAQGDTGVAYFALGFAVLAGLALLPTYAQAVLAGWAFGLQAGSIGAMCGIAGASMIGYVIALRTSGDRVVNLIDEQPKWRVVYDALLSSGKAKTLAIVTLLRVPPNSPFAITNLVMAACKVKPVTYVIGTVVGIAPRTIAAVFVGAGVSQSDFEVPKDRWMFVAGLVALLIVVSIIGMVANRALKRMTSEQQSDSSPL